MPQRQSDWLAKDRAGKVIRDNQLDLMAYQFVPSKEPLIRWWIPGGEQTWPSIGGSLDGVPDRVGQSDGEIHESGFESRRHHLCCPVLMRKSSQRPGCIFAMPASQSCQVRKVE